uniref:Interferon lambda-3-like n=1 Tax=Peromyscus maniculatus bairdii TaxID=230844 RepID=A0A8C8ULB0_PERMB
MGGKLSLCGDCPPFPRVSAKVLVTVVLGLATAASVPPSKPTPARTGCHIGIFQSVSLWELGVFKKAKDALVSFLPVSPPYVLFLTYSQVQERPRALQAELALTLKVLENMTDSALVPILDQPLHTLRHIHSQLQACTQPQPTAEPRPVSRRLSRWLHRLQEAQRKETPGCLEDSVTSNLFRLLIRDLKCVASGDQCA